MNKQRMGTRERAHAGASLTGRDHFPLRWKAVWELKKHYKIDDWASTHKAGDVITERGEGNCVLRQGAIVFWQRLVTLNPSTAATGNLTAFSSGTAYIGVSTSTSTADSTQNGLGGSTKWYEGMSTAAYPTVSTNASSSGSMQAIFQAIFSSSEANIGWKEWVIANAGTSSAYHLNRFVQDLGTKSSAATWTMTATVAFSSA
jgi:hypothetical protein